MMPALVIEMPAESPGLVVVTLTLPATSAPRSWMLSVELTVSPASGPSAPAGALMKGMQMYSATRYMVLTGVHPMTHWGLLQGPRNWVPIVLAALSLFSFPFWQAGLPLMLGTIMNWIFKIEGDPYQLKVYTCIWATVCNAPGSR